MRFDDDQWDVTTSVGATALMVAAFRARETGRPGDPLVRDPYAQAFVDASGTDLPIPAAPDAGSVWDVAVTYMGIRSRVFDDELTAAVEAGTTQVVVLAAGLDARACRLGWPSGVTVYEVDQPEVLDFKDRVLAEQGVPPGPRRVPVAVDLRHDWPAALRAAGFDPSRPTVWLAEGLLPYLPPDAQELLFHRVHELCAPGSRIAVEDFGPVAARLSAQPDFAELWIGMTGSRMAGLLYDGPRADPPAWLSARGWRVSTRPIGTYVREYGRWVEHDAMSVASEVGMMRADLAG